MTEVHNCDHDWRVDPNIVLLSNPPQQRIVCVECGKTSSRLIPGAAYVGPNVNPGSWEKAERPRSAHGEFRRGEPGAPTDRTRSRSKNAHGYFRK